MAQTRWRPTVGPPRTERSHLPSPAPSFASGLSYFPLHRPQSGCGQSSDSRESWSQQLRDTAERLESKYDGRSASADLSEGEALFASEFPNDQSTFLQHLQSETQDALVSLLRSSNPSLRSLAAKGWPISQICSMFGVGTSKGIFERLIAFAKDAPFEEAGPLLLAARQERKDKDRMPYSRTDPEEKQWKPSDISVAYARYRLQVGLTATGGMAKKRKNHDERPLAPQSRDGRARRRRRTSARHIPLYGSENGVPVEDEATDDGSEMDIEAGRLAASADDSLRSTPSASPGLSGDHYTPEMTSLADDDDIGDDGGLPHHLPTIEEEMTESLLASNKPAATATRTRSCVSMPPLELLEHGSAEQVTDNRLISPPQSRTSQSIRLTPGASTFPRSSAPHNHSTFEDVPSATSDRSHAMHDFLSGSHISSSVLDDILALCPSRTIRVMSSTFLDIDRTSASLARREHETVHKDLTISDQTIVIPLLHTKIQHCTVAFINLQQHSVCHYDPLRNDRCAQDANAAVHTFLFWLSSGSPRWTYTEATDWPKQPDDHSSGVYVALATIFRSLNQAQPIEGWDCELWRQLLPALVASKQRDYSALRRSSSSASSIAHGQSQHGADIQHRVVLSYQGENQDATDGVASRDHREHRLEQHVLNHSQALSTDALRAYLQVTYYDITQKRAVAQGLLNKGIKRRSRIDEAKNILQMLQSESGVGDMEDLTRQVSLIEGVMAKHQNTSIAWKSLERSRDALAQMLTMRGTFNGAYLVLQQFEDDAFKESEGARLELDEIAKMQEDARQFAAAEPGAGAGADVG